MIYNLPVLQFVVQVLLIDLKILIQLWEIASEGKLKKKINNTYCDLKSIFNINKSY